MEYFWLFALSIVIYLVIRDKSGKRRKSTRRSNATSRRKSEQDSSGLFEYQEKGKEPEIDGSGRVVVKLKSGNGLAFGVNLRHIEDAEAEWLLGKKQSDEEVDKSVRLRMFLDKESKFENSIRVETVKGKLIGWILKDDSELAARSIATLRQGIIGVDPALTNRELVFDVSARIEGMWDEDEEDSEVTFTPDLSSVEIRIKDPAEIEIS